MFKNACRISVKENLSKKKKKKKKTHSRRSGAEHFGGSIDQKHHKLFACLLSLINITYKIKLFCISLTQKGKIQEYITNFLKKKESNYQKINKKERK